MHFGNRVQETYSHKDSNNISVLPFHKKTLFILNTKTYLFYSWENTNMVLFNIYINDLRVHANGEQRHSKRNFEVARWWSRIVCFPKGCWGNNCYMKDFWKNMKSPKTPSQTHKNASNRAWHILLLDLVSQIKC